MSSQQQPSKYFAIFYTHIGCATAAAAAVGARFSFYRSLAHTDGRASKCCGEKSKVFRPHINQSGSTLHVIFFAARNNAFLINGKRGNWEEYFTIKSQTSLPITLSARPTHVYLVDQHAAGL